MKAKNKKTLFDVLTYTLFSDCLQKAEINQSQDMLCS